MSSRGDAKEECSSDQSVIQRYPRRKNCYSIPVIDLCESDSDSIEAIKGKTFSSWQTIL